MYAIDVVTQILTDIGNSLIDLLLTAMVLVAVFLIYNAIMAVVQGKQNKKGYSAFFID